VELLPHPTIPGPQVNMSHNKISRQHPQVFHASWRIIEAERRRGVATQNSLTA
jgi:hypothetical protein